MLQLRELGSSLTGPLVEIWTKMWPTVSELEVLDLPWVYWRGKDSKAWGDGNVRMDWSLKTYLPTRIGRGMHLEDRPFTATVRSKSAGGALAASVKRSVTAVLCGPDLVVGTAVTELGNRSAMGVTGSQGLGPGGGTQQPKARWALHHKGQQSKNCNQNSLTHPDLWCGLLIMMSPEVEQTGNLPDSHVIWISRKF